MKKEKKFHEHFEITEKAASAIREFVTKKYESKDSDEMKKIEEYYTLVTLSNQESQTVVLKSDLEMYSKLFSLTDEKKCLNL